MAIALTIFSMVTMVHIGGGQVLAIGLSSILSQLRSKLNGYLCKDIAHTQRVFISGIGEVTQSNPLILPKLIRVL